jgi:hypothetical protein
MRKYLARLFTGTKAHLIQIAPIFDGSLDVLTRMRAANEEECEAVFLSLVEGRCGGRVDWRGSAADIYEALEPCLSSDERRYLPSVESIQLGPPARVVQMLDSYLAQAPRALRALDSLGDFIIVLLVPRDRLSEFDHATRFWAA